MKLSPLLLFLLLVLILVISVVFCKNFTYPLSEGFVNYNLNVIPTQKVVINAYGQNSVVKLFDNLFFDDKNGNVIEVDSSRFTGNVDAQGNFVSGNIDNTGASINNYYISTRDGTMKQYSKDDFKVKTSGLNTGETIVSSSYKHWSYDVKCQNTGKYKFFYVPWNTETYIHIIETTFTPAYYGEPSHNPTNIYSFKFSGGSNEVGSIRYNNTQLPLNPISNAADTDINKQINDSYYSSTRKVYKLSSSFEFDVSNSNLIVRSPTSITVYGRSKDVIATSNQPLQNVSLNNTIQSVTYNSWVVNNSENNSQIVYVASGMNTLLLVINKNASGSYDLANVARFNSYGLDDGTATTAPTTSSGNTPSQSGIPDGSGNAISDYYKWYWYWNSIGGGNKLSDNYILKTQIVPPVCPKCPNCPNSSGACVNCGGKGGAGTIVSNDVNKDVGNAVGGIAKGAGGIAQGAGQAVGGIAQGAGQAVGGIAQGAGQAVGGIASGVAGIANTAISTTGNVANNLINSSNKTNLYQGASQGAGQGASQPGFSQGAPPIDNYSYYGALPSKQSNFIPITADFSKFGK